MDYFLFIMGINTIFFNIFLVFYYARITFLLHLLST